MADGMQDYFMGGSEAANSGARDPLDFLTSNIPSRTTPINPMSISRPSNLNLNLSEDAMLAMLKQIQDIFDSEPEDENEDQVMAEDEEDVEEEVDLEDQQRRMEKLKMGLSPLAQLWWSGSEKIDLAAEKLADRSRETKWRIPLGDSGILNFFLEILRAHTLRHALKIHILRLIGNSCADKVDENRGRVVASNYLPSIILQLKDTSLLPFAIPVLYNICMDFDPAQLQASNSFLSKELIELISGPALNECRAFLVYICRILNLIVTQPAEPANAPEHLVMVLFQIAVDRESPCDMDDYVALVKTAVAYMKHEKFQKALVAQGGIDTSLSVLVDSYTRFDSAPSIGTSSPDQDEARALSEMRSSLNQVFADVSVLPEFVEAYPVISPVTSSLRRWLSSPQLQLQVCACIMLGNLARSKEACIEFVHTSQVHRPLTSIITETNDSQLLHSAIGFLKNLAQPAENKELIGTDEIWAGFPRLWLMDTLQPVQHSSISLARLLIDRTFENVRRVCRRLSKDEDSPAYQRSNLSLLIALFDRTDIEPVKMEISRLITAVCRTFNTHSFTNPDIMTRVRRNFFTMHPDVGRPLAFMVSQTKWPVVRSEGWFVFALMAHFPDGAQCISDMMQDVSVFQPLVELLTGKNIVDYKSPSPSAPTSASTPLAPLLPPPPHQPQHLPPTTFPLDSPTPPKPQPHAQAAEMARLDRENALVMVNELLKNMGGQMAVMRKTLFEDLLKGGGQLVMSYREAQPMWGDKTKPKNERVRAGLNLQEATVESLKELMG
ncbi:hypothetical protein LHYA1_G006454 [Lachnellula hyalina]|uniref:ARM repeat-containing protein n=1 Tax=Lachnellula hyalina TaxID=1316788 RepID=A0A8H8R081_9HELO|nr:uncharacterized protein LHYA1_G006454 [Lachnellula hyalina]TVY25020.1 hypothetical protein LHYA1_G006454 [Lachnellula hyalina]